MKFSRQLRLSRVPDWAEHYLDYSRLKRLLRKVELELAISGRVDHLDFRVSRGQGDVESLIQGPWNAPDYGNGPSPAAPPLRRPSHDAGAQEAYGQIQAGCLQHSFQAALERELTKVVRFYCSTEHKLFEEINELSELADGLATDSAHHQVFSAQGIPGLMGSEGENSSSSESEHDEECDHQGSAQASQRAGRTVQTMVGIPAYSGVSSHYLTSSPDQDGDQQRGHYNIAKRAVTAYLALVDLCDFATLNRTGIRRLLKKYSAITNQTRFRHAFAKRVDESYPFEQQAKSKVIQRTAILERIYAQCLTQNDADIAGEHMRFYLRQHIVSGHKSSLENLPRCCPKRRISITSEHEVKPRMIAVDLRGHTLKLPRIPPQLLHCLVAIFMLLVVLSVSNFLEAEQRACLAVLLFAAYLWATEALPLFITSLCVPLLVVLLRIPRDPVSSVRLHAVEAADFVFRQMFSHVIMLLLGGFSIASALSKHSIAKMFAISILKRAGTKTIWVLLANMMVATLASMWISNVAAPVLCFSIIQPILHGLPPKSPFGPALVLGIAFASNIGGMASPIASPQNVIALSTMSPAPSWAQWFAITIPMCTFCNAIIWMILLVVYRPHVGTPEIMPLQRSDAKLNAKQWFILGVTLVTIALWCAEQALVDVVGDMGVIAIIPIVALFGTNMLDRNDFNQFLWTVVMLAMGGIVLGKAIDNSGLLVVIAGAISVAVEGLSLWTVLAVFAVFMLVIASFISHTVATLIVLPIVKEVGLKILDDQGLAHPRLLVMCITLMSSGAMCLPVSGFPNMNAACQENPLGKPYVTTWDFIRAGIPSSFGACLSIMTVGFGICWALGL